MLLENEKFLSELGKLFMKSRMTGNSQSLRITMKPYDGREKPIPRGKQLDDDASLVLFRAVVGAEKISTVVRQKEVNQFHAQYSACLLRNMDGLQRAKKTTDGSAKTSATNRPKN
ncbi:unnamed protein product, partial [Mesorhabditis spiculigera]